MTFRCLAIDDEPLALKQLVTYIDKVPFLELAAQCQSALEAREFLENDTVDAIFCDINMPDLNGMDFVKSLAVPPLVIFTTAYSEYAVEGFRVNAVDYLLKPFGFQEFQRAVQRLIERKGTASPLAHTPMLSTSDFPRREGAGMPNTNSNGERTINKSIALQLPPYGGGRGERPYILVS